MASHYTNLLFMMLWLCSMAIYHLIFHCEYGQTFSIEHALSCSKGGFPTLRHNEIQDITASLLTEVCSEVCVEPNLQPVSSDQLNGATANSQEGVRLNVSANGVWGGRFQKTYFDVRVFNPLAPSNRNQNCQRYTGNMN